MKKFVILVAAGSGSRMQSDLPKQFHLLNGKPVLMQTIFQFYNSDPSISIILVLPELHISYWKELTEKYKFSIKHDLVSGGITRFDSVKNGLNFIKENGFVAVHDGVRPLISSDCITRLYNDAKNYGNAIPVIPVNDSLRTVEGITNNAVDRSRIRIIQTPQIFEVQILKQAFKQPFQNSFTDEATVMEHFGVPIHLSEGEIENIKITTPNDLRYAEVCLGNKQ